MLHLMLRHEQDPERTLSWDIFFHNLKFTLGHRQTGLHHLQTEGMEFTETHTLSC